jgi:hypothetical protein
MQVVIGVHRRQDHLDEGPTEESAVVDGDDCIATDLCSQRSCPAPRARRQARKDAELPAAYDGMILDLCPRQS